MVAQNGLFFQPNAFYGLLATPSPTLDTTRAFGITNQETGAIITPNIPAPVGGSYLGGAGNGYLTIDNSSSIDPSIFAGGITGSLAADLFPPNYGTSSVGAAETGESAAGTTALPPCSMWGLDYLSGKCTLGGGTTGATPTTFGSATATNQAQQPGTTGTPAQSEASIAGSLKSVTDSLQSTLKTLLDGATWQRVALVAIGTIVLLAAIFLFGFSAIHSAERA